MKFNRFICALLFSLLSIPIQSWADDTDLYLLPPPNQGRSKVLIIFDNSASMETIVQGLPSGYKPNTVYPAVGSSHSYSGRMIYFTIGTGMDESSLPIPDSPSESRRFNELINGCAAATEALNKYGRFTGYIREFKTTGNDKGTWQQVKENSGAEKTNPVDCWEDIDAENTSNNRSITGFVDGYPQNSVKKGNEYLPFGGTLANAKAMGFNSGLLVTLYTDNYLRWYTLYKNGSLPVDDEPQTRLAIAKEAISGVISSISSVDFGIAVFNLNHPNEGERDGGRIIAGIKSRTAVERNSLINTISGLPAKTNTPLCETMFEAYRYFSGGPVTFGHSDTDYNGGEQHYSKNNPPYDVSIENGAKYISPMDVCNDTAFVIYITDGEPVLDESANSYITALTSAGNVAGNYSRYTYKAGQGSLAAKNSYLPALASYMYQNDLLPATEKFQRIITHTIGFSLGEDSDAEPLLVETATRGHGQYFSADNIANLQAALANIVDSITNVGQRFSAPGVAFSNADPTRTLDSAYYALFSPSQGSRWAGNLKKLKVNSSGTLVDVNGEPAISSSGGIKDSACSFWSDCASAPDGNNVEDGGAARQINPDTRKLLSNVGADGGVASLTVANASSKAGGDSALVKYLGLADVSELPNHFDWIKGKNIDRDETGKLTSSDYAGVRGDIMGDPMHSQPLAIDYGGDGSNVRIFVGTNHGALHAFRDSGSTVSETWAFMPYELLRNTTTLRMNSYANGHSVYGVDGSPVAYTERTAGVVTKAWLFIGMRRGGRYYYAFDITNPDEPSLMWQISNETAGFADLGQTWSTPVITRIPGVSTPVAIFGGGYNLGYDSLTGTNSDGRSIYVVNAESGALVYRFGPNGDTPLPAIEDSIPGAIATLDSNGDGVTDRLYAADLGGNVWRMDLPSASSADWSAFKFASLGSALTSDDRRFFYEPVLAQTSFTNQTEVTTTTGADSTKNVTYQNIPYDAVTLGSGNRAAPLNTAVRDMFFVLQDRNVVTKTFGSGGEDVPETLTMASLYDVTSSSPTTQAENIAFGAKRGWFYDFSLAGEKSLSPSTIIKGKVYFTSFVPAQAGTASSDTSCLITSNGRLYSLDLHKGARYTDTAEYIDICTNCIPQPPKIITPPVEIKTPCTENCDDPKTEQQVLSSDCETSAVLMIGSGTCDETGLICTGTVNLNSCLSTNKIYYHIDE